MPDMLVKLYNLSGDTGYNDELKKSGIAIKRAMSPDKHLILDFIRENFEMNWVSECDVTFSRQPVSTFIATRNSEVIGFSCFDTTCRGFFGPMGVKKSEQGKGIGKVLLLSALLAMREYGYGYAIIGWTDVANDFYAKHAGATLIEDSSPGVYKDLINQ